MTSAVKYGALSHDKGHVELTWSVNRGNKGPRLKLHWHEKDGPPVKKPTSSGFGTQLIRRGIPGATVSHEFRRQGVECTIEVPLSEPKQDGPDGTRR
jgi:two-component system, chemotaxis family, CheB/CheR fusion protein